MTPTPNPFQRPSKPQTSQSPQSPAFAKPTNSNPTKKVIPPPSKSNSGGGGRQGTGGGGNGGGNNPPQPSPWLNPDNEPIPDSAASFVEYLRWMRSPDHEYKDTTKVQILQLATEQDNCNYNNRLNQLSDRTELIAGKDNTFQVKCPWRIRVGGHRGPESILLPAFDALGMPYIPSSTLRGVARNQGIQEIMAKNSCDWKEAEKQIAPYFGSLEANKENQAGKVIFLDAYPLPNQHGLAMDMANNIWTWNNNEPEYSPNPNPFLSLKKATFLIGLRLASGCQNEQTLEQVKQWLIKGLQAGIGSQVNTGYGQLINAGTEQPKNDEFFRLEFTLEGQLIHGCQKFTQWRWNDNRNEWQMRGTPEAEIRPTAFKSMLRYWFRAFTLGVLSTNQTKDWEGRLFGAINPKQREWVEFKILEGQTTQKEPRPTAQGKNDKCGEQIGILTLAYSSEAPKTNRQELVNLMKTTTWITFNLGGIGQGARRPCYSRQNRAHAPWYRGSSFGIESDDLFWELPESISDFKSLFQQNLKSFYHSLNQLTGIEVNYQLPKNIGTVTSQNWTEAVDANCKIVVCQGQEKFGKPYALSILHSDQLNPNRNRDGNKIYEPNLCGKVQGGVKPSPVWIADLGNYQVVTVFGATQNPRWQYWQELRNQTLKNNYIQIFPLT